MSNEISPEKRLWQTVVYRALIDATAENPAGPENIRAKRDAISWLKTGGRDFRKVCSLAEIDPDFVREAFLAGRIDPVLLRAAEQKDGIVEAAE
jgi:hypothetical protein